VAYRFGSQIRAALNSPDEHDVVGYHGTSLWAVLCAARFGALPNRSLEERRFFYFPIEYPAAWAEASDYARSNSIVHFAREFVPYDSIDAFFAALDVGDHDPNAVAEDVVAEGALRGVVISLRSSVAALPSEPIDIPENERCVRVGRAGLPIRHIALIHPLGIRDQEILGDHGLL
jgi:hypothetical protein